MVPSRQRSRRFLKLCFTWDNCRGIAPVRWHKRADGKNMEIGDQVLRQQDWLFHRLAPFYDYLIRRPQADRLRDLLDLPPNGVMVDVGGGMGRVSSHFSGLTANVLVCDINRSMLKQAQRKKALIPLQAAAEDLPFPADTVDGILEE